MTYFNVVLCTEFIIYKMTKYIGIAIYVLVQCSNKQCNTRAFSNYMDYYIYDKGQIYFAKITSLFMIFNELTI